jgi:site-specific DNA-methyltransferase (adenine-specific)
MSGIATEDDGMTKDAAAMSAPSAGSLPLDQIICGDNCEVMRQMPSESIDLVVTSPPYDDLRTYGGHSWDFYGVAWNLKRLLKPGGVIVWNVNDATKDGSETGTSMRQAIFFQTIGLQIHDTMIWEKTGSGALGSQDCYAQNFEYVFVFANGKPARLNLIADRRNQITSGTVKVNCSLRPDKTSVSRFVERQEFGKRTNVWRMTPAQRQDHPAPFPDELARDHILSWSNESDVVLDPFSGSGTTAKMAREAGRRFIGIEVNPEYVEISRKRLAQQLLPMGVA